MTARLLCSLRHKCAAHVKCIRHCLPPVSSPTTISCSLPSLSIYFSYFPLQRASKTELRLNSSRHFYSIFEFSFLSCRRQVKSRLDTLNTQANTLTHTYTHTYIFTHIHSACFHVEIEIFPIEIAIVFCHCVARTDVLQLLECLPCPATLTPLRQPTMGY